MDLVAFLGDMATCGGDYFDDWQVNRCSAGACINDCRLTGQPDYRRRYCRYSIDYFWIPACDAKPVLKQTGY